MAPRRRTPKVGLRRIDAALDALRPMGFEDSLVRRTVRSLLKTYGGDNGWAFIEEGSYRLVIDTILEEQANEDCCSQKDGIAGDEPEEQAPSSPFHSAGTEPTCSRSQPPLDTVSSSPKDDSSHQEKLELPPLSPQIHDKDTSNFSTKDQTTEDRTRREFFSSGASPPPSMDSLPSRQLRKPYYGWVSNNSDEDLVYLTPAAIRYKKTNGLG